MTGTRRALAAEATRQAILEAARGLFVTQGYAATSVQEIATEAGVAVQTIYSSVGSKAAVLLALNDSLDVQAEVAARAGALAEERDPRRLLGGAVSLTRALNEPGWDLLGLLLAAAPSEPDVARAVADGMERHRLGSERVGRALSSMAALADGQTADSAARALGLLTSPASWRQLVGDGLTFDEAEAWIATSLVRLLLREPAS